MSEEPPIQEEEKGKPEGSPAGIEEVPDFSGLPGSLPDKPQKIKNRFYRDFLDNGMIQTLDLADIKRAQKNVTGRNIREGQQLITALYYTGGRPNEVLSLRAKDILIDGTYMTMQLKGSKRGLSRKLYFKLSTPLIKELAEYVRELYPEVYIFHHYRNNYIRVRTLRRGNVRRTLEVSDKLRYYFKQWFNWMDGIPPYYLRHNRFSKVMQKGGTMEEIRLMKGAKNMNSVTPYLHMSQETAKKISKKVD